MQKNNLWYKEKIGIMKEEKGEILESVEKSMVNIKVITKQSIND